MISVDNNIIDHKKYKIENEEDRFYCKCLEELLNYDVIENNKYTKKKIYLKACLNNSNLFKNSPLLIRNDFGYSYEMVKDNPELYNWCTDELKSNKRLVKLVLKSGKIPLNMIPKDFSLNKKYIILALRSNPWQIKYINEKFKEDTDIIYESLKGDGICISILSDKIKDNYFFAEMAVTNNGDSYQYLSERLKNTKSIVIRSVKTTGTSLKYMSEKWRDDESVYIIAFESNEMSYEFASKRIRSIDNYCLSAIKDNSKNILYYEGNNHYMYHLSISENKEILKFLSKNTLDEIYKDIEDGDYHSFSKNFVKKYNYS